MTVGNGNLVGYAVTVGYCLKKCVSQGIKGTSSCKGRIYPSAEDRPSGVSRQHFPEDAWHILGAMSGNG